MFIVRFLGRLVQAIWYGLNTIRRVLHLVLLLFIFGLVLAVGIGQPVPVPSSAALVIEPTGTLVEQLQGGPLERALAEMNNQLAPETLLRDITDSIDRAAEDDRIQMIVLSLDGLDGGGLAKLQAVGEALKAFRATGKKVVTFGSGFTRDQYYLAAQSDEIVMHDLGLVYLEGYEYYRTFFKSALAKLKVDLNVFRVGEFKSFVEPYIRDDMSAEDREASEQWLMALWGTWETEVAGARELTKDALDAYANELAGKLEAVDGNAARAALDAGLVDKLMNRPEMDAYVAGIVGESDTGDGGFSGIDFRSYLRATALERRLLDTHARNVAIIVASGQIVDGEAPPGTIGGDTLAAEIRDARMDETVDAVVLRIDSPGGSMYASEVVFDEIEALKADGKPLVASMSSVAASGGYYIAMLADEIWSSNATITGSIGVGALFPTVQRGLSSLGVNVDGFGTTKLAGQLRLDRPLGDDARRILAVTVQDAYRIFVGKVADSRKLSRERADEVARGRVWIGADARDLGLIDRIGGLDDAIRSAAVRAGLEEGAYGKKYIEPHFSLMERVAADLGVRAMRTAQRVGIPVTGFSDGLLRAALKSVDEDLRQLAAFNDPRGVYLHCFCAAD